MTTQIYMKTLFHFIRLLSFSLLLIFFSSCNNGPKQISSQTNQEEVLKNSEIFGDGQHVHSDDASGNEDVHTVLIKEVLPTQKYIYLKVSENDGEEFWIATLKQEVNVGEVYVYAGGLLKTNFKSIEHNRFFEKLYLVNNIAPAGHADPMHSDSPIAPGKEAIENTETVIRKGSVTIAEIVANPTKYSGKTIQVSGKCVKVNPEIMDRNWMHLQDGSKDDYDFVVTSDVAVPVGHNITFKGKLNLNKDFGAGYKYEIIMENGVLVD
jgi:hypothetical protein